jgi:hypothetical protein
MGRNSCKTDRCKKLMKWIDGARGGGIGGGKKGLSSSCLMLKGDIG